VRYADGGGLTAEGRARRERVRLAAAEMFGQDADPAQIARSLRVSTKSVYQWRRAWKAGGEAALASRGPGGSACRLDDAQLAELRAALEAGPAAHGWDQDQRWTLARAAALAGRLFGVSYTLRGMSFLLHLWVPKTCATWADGALRDPVGSVARTVPCGQVLARQSVG
jgi:transposase